MGLFLSEVMSKVSERPRVYPASQYGFTHRVASENKIEEEYETREVRVDGKIKTVVRDRMPLVFKCLKAGRKLLYATKEKFRRIRAGVR